MAMSQYDGGMEPGMPTGDKPWGNSNSLVPEISGRGVNGMSVKPCKYGQAAKIEKSTHVRNNSFQDLKDTGRS